RARFRLMDLKAEDARQVLQVARLARPRPVRPREPPPNSLERRRRLFATLRQPLDDARAREGLKRALLAGWARELGLRASPAEIRAARRTLGSGAPPDELERLAEEAALEDLVLAFAPRMLNDGPSAQEAAAAERRRR